MPSTDARHALTSIQKVNEPLWRGAAQVPGRNAQGVAQPAVGVFHLAILVENGNAVRQGEEQRMQVLVPFP
jgi:biotin carboxyl carrier protein